MTKILLGTACAGLSLLFLTTMASAGPIESACMKSNRQAANRSLCSCIQQVADVTLRGGDQRLAASFFKNPERAQKVHMSQSQRDDAFWRRYVNFGKQAAQSCQG